MKFFTWGGETVQQEIMKSLGYIPVPLETSDILPGIQTGMINAVPSTPYFALATQIYNSAPYMLDLNWAPIVGALVVTRKAWEEMRPETQSAVREAGARAGARMRTQARLEVGEAVEAMKKRGLTVNQPNAEQMKEWLKLADTLYPRIRGKMIPAETFDEVVGLLKEYRATKAK
jgi:TRAP-type C4-dicarboxylate transport system substrate-binding protein